MKSTNLIMGMPVVVEAVDDFAKPEDLEKAFEYFNHVDEKFSTYKQGSEISKINEGFIGLDAISEEMREVFDLSEKTKQETNGYFDIKQPSGKIDPSGLVKGWAINNAANILKERGLKNFYVEAGGDIQTFGLNQEHRKWSIGIKNPFDQSQIVKVVFLSGQGIATSGTYIRGQHIYNPLMPEAVLNDIASFTVIGPNVYEADRFATACFAMGLKGINFLENLPGFEGYMIDKGGIATLTSGFGKFL